MPAAYAEKTMHSLLRLHEELMEEKERRIDLYRRLMTREQELAELRAYVRLLEAEVAKDEGVPASAPAPAPQSQHPAGRASAPVEPPPRTPPAAPRAPAAERQAPAMEQEAPQTGRDAPPRGEAGPTVAWLPSNLYRTGK